MKSTILFPLLTLAGVLCVASSASPIQAQPAVRAKKLIITGYDHPTCAQLRRDWAAMEAMPFDGTVFEAKISPEGAAVVDAALPLRAAFENKAWKREWFAPSIENLRAVHSKRLTDNFVNLNAGGSQSDFFDDAAWKQIVDHFAIAAWYVKSAGIKGIEFDPEHYGLPDKAQWTYSRQPQRAQHDFPAYATQARLRGRQVMQAMARENDGLTLLCFFLNSYNLAAARSPQPMKALEGEGYGLLSPFFDGMLDAAPSGIRFIDATEQAYGFNDEITFLRSYKDIKNTAMNLVSPANHNKYRAQVSAGFGLYVDAYSIPIGQKYSLISEGDSRTARLEQNLSTALAVSDEYVWLYGEAGRWWPEPGDLKKWAGVTVSPPWTQVLPGSLQAVEFARDPDAAARKYAQANAAAPNLAANGDFSATKEMEAPNPATIAADWLESGIPGWRAWQDEKSKGAFTLDKTIGAARVAGVKEGCWIQSVPCKPGEVFFVAVKQRKQGNGVASVLVRWKTADGKWTQQPMDRALASSPPDARGWSQAQGSVRVPSEAGQMILLLLVNGQEIAEDVAWFDDVVIKRIAR